MLSNEKNIIPVAFINIVRLEYINNMNDVNQKKKKKSVTSYL